MPLRIRRAQLQALQIVPEVDFRSRLCSFARENLASAVAPLNDQDLLWRVRSGINRARSHGFAWQSSIATFVMLMLRFAPNFDDYPPIRAILAAKGEERAEALLDVSAEDWNEVEDRCDLKAWYDFAPGAAEDLR